MNSIEEKAKALVSLKSDMSQDEYEECKTKCLLQLQSIGRDEAYSLLLKFKDIHLIDENEFNVLKRFFITQVLPLDISSPMSLDVSTWNDEQICAVIEEINLEEKVQTLGIPKDATKQTRWLVSTLHSFLLTLNKIDPVEAWKVVTDMINFATTVINSFIDIVPLCPSPWSHALRGCLKVLVNVEKTDKKKVAKVIEKVLLVLQYYVNFLLESGKVEELEVLLDKNKKKLSSTITQDVGKALLTSVGVGALFVVASPAILSVLGFGSAGIVAGSFAASIMGPSVSAGSLFAICQSIGVIGLSGVATGGLAIAGAAVGFAAFGITKLIKNRKDTGSKL